MGNSFRLTSNCFWRESESEKVNVYKTIFLAMEGTVSEKCYIDGLNKCKNKLGLDSSIFIEELKRKRKDGCSAPEQVIELLEEYLELRDSTIYEQIKSLFKPNFTEKVLKTFIENPNLLDKQTRDLINLELTKIGYDLEYKKYLKTLPEHEDDMFGIVIDKDSRSNITEIINYCKEKGFKIFISNPCFELWLLLHWEDVSKYDTDTKKDILNNKKVSAKHTYTSKLVSEKGHHAKYFNFENVYLDKVYVAMKNVKKLETDVLNLDKKIGSNFFEVINFMKKSDT